MRQLKHFDSVVCLLYLARYCENFIKIGRQTPEILQIFLWGVFLPPPWFFTCGENLVPMSVNLLTCQYWHK